jgi:DNA gyrase subunit A
MVVMVTHGGYVKRTPLFRPIARSAAAARAARHGDEGGGFRHAPVRGEHAQPILFFSSTGMAYKHKSGACRWRAPHARAKR